MTWWTDTYPGGVTTEGEAARPRLTRSRTDKVIGGVAGGLGHYLGVDPVILRIAFVVLLFTGPGFLLYIVGWIVMPLGDDAPRVAGHAAPSGDAIRMLIGGLLVAIGAIVLINQVVPWFDKVILPSILIAIGTAVLVYGARR